MEPTSSPVKKSSWWSRLAMGLVMALCLLWWYKWNEPSAPAQFFYQYFKPFPLDSLQARSAGDSLSKAIWEKSLHIYEGRAYARVVDLFQALSLQWPEDPLMKLYLAQGYIGLKEKAPALAVLKEVEAAGPSWEETARWYRALVYLQHNQRDSCLYHLEGIHGSYSDLARYLENDLNG